MVGEFITAPVFSGSPMISPDLQKMVYLSPVGETYEELAIHWVDLTTATDSVPGAGTVRLFGWTPDSSRYVYGAPDGTGVKIHEFGFPPTTLSDQPRTSDIQWIDSNQFLFLSGKVGLWELRLGTPGGVSTVIANPPDDFVTYDFTK
jgi:hypothetical protein